MTEHFFEKWAHTQGAYRVHPQEEYLKIISSTGVLKQGRDKIVLEAGCGSGGFTQGLCDQGFSVIGLDSCYKLLELAPKRENILYVNAEALKLPFKDASIDVVFCGAFLHHLPRELPGVLSIFSRVLKPFGSIYFFEPYSPCLNSFVHYRVIRTNLAEGEMALDPQKLNKHLGDCGFEEITWKTMRRVRHVYSTAASPLSHKILGAARKLVNEVLLPNVFFVGSARKRRVF